MIKEFYKKRIKDQNVRFQDSSAISEYLREENVIGLRLYVTGLIGVAGSIKKNCDFMDLEKRALKNAKKNKYPVDSSNGLQQKIIYNYEISSEKNYKEAMVTFVDDLKSKMPEYNFFGQISLIDREESLKNDMSLNLHYVDHYVIMNMRFSKAGETWSIPFTYRGRRFSREVFTKIVSQICDACKVKATPVKKRMPVLFSCSNRSPFNHLFCNLDGRKVGEGLSKFSFKMNQQVLNSKFTLFCSHDIENIITPFFDMEGSVVRTEDNPLSPFRYPLIKNGIFNAPFSDKVTAKKYNYPITGSAIGAYNVPPFPGISHFQLSTTHEKLHDLLCGENGILVINASNVYYGVDGEFSCITKEAFLTNGDTLIGKLPPIKISTSSENMFGSDYLGCTRHVLYPMYGRELFGFYSNVELL
ncbi:MAG: hypothetical protein KAH01_08050 [Caldisericia bacterium]|nr:hypothetical protein [Caldisericia bacterium]